MRIGDPVASLDQVRAAVGSWADLTVEMIKALNDRGMDRADAVMFADHWMDRLIGNAAYQFEEDDV